MNVEIPKAPYTKPNWPETECKCKDCAYWNESKINKFHAEAKEKYGQEWGKCQNKVCPFHCLADWTCELAVKKEDGLMNIRE